MDLVVIGAGYVGLTAAACFAEMGHHVICVDKNREKIETLLNKKLPIHEPGLLEIVLRNAKAKRLNFSTELTPSAIYFIAVDTPCQEDGSANISSVLSVSEAIAHQMNGYTIIVNKSTSPVGTTRQITTCINSILKKRGKNLSFDVVSNPEFLKEGNALDDFMKPDRIIIGTDSPKAYRFMKKVYHPFMLNHERLIWMDPESSEMTKYAANAMLASRISFMNEMAGLCEKLGADIDQVRKGIGADQRIGYQYLYAGAGFGGSCFPKDLKSLQFQANACDQPTLLLDAIDQVNENQKRHLFQKIENYFENSGGIQGKTIGILGLSFKPNTDDMRQAASLVMIQLLLQREAILRLYDPIAMENAKKILPDHPNITWCEDEQETASSADALVLMTEWKQFRLLDFPSLLSSMKGNAFFDGRNQYQPNEMQEIGFEYFSIGRQPTTQEILQKSPQ